MDDDKVALGHDHARLVLEGRGSTLYEVEETFAARLDMGAMLNVVGRPEAFSCRVVALVELSLRGHSQETKLELVACLRSASTSF